MCKAPCASDCFCSRTSPLVTWRHDAAAVAQNTAKEIMLLLYQVDVHPANEVRRAVACRMLGVTSGDAGRDKDAELYDFR